MSIFFILFMSYFIDIDSKHMKIELQSAIIRRDYEIISSYTKDEIFYQILKKDNVLYFRSVDENNKDRIDTLHIY